MKGEFSRNGMSITDSSLAFANDVNGASGFFDRKYEGSVVLACTSPLVSLSLLSYPFILLIFVLAFGASKKKLTFRDVTKFYGKLGYPSQSRGD